MEMHLISISFSCGQLKDYFCIDIHMETSPFNEMQKRGGEMGGGGRNADKGEGVAGEPCPQGSSPSSDGETDAIQRAHKPGLFTRRRCACMRGDTHMHPGHITANL